jgi:hypothetical protein
MRNLSRYAELAEELHAVEDSIMQTRVTMIGIEQSQMAKTIPRPRSIHFMRNLLKYADLAKKLRAEEESMMRIRVAMIEVEQSLLNEEIQGAAMRSKQADRQDHLVHANIEPELVLLLDRGPSLPLSWDTTIARASLSDLNTQARGIE